MSRNKCDHELIDDGMFCVLCIKCGREIECEPGRVEQLEDAVKAFYELCNRVGGPSLNESRMTVQRLKETFGAEFFGEKELPL